MRKTLVYNHDELAGELIEITPNKNYEFNYSEDYSGRPISLTMPKTQKSFQYKSFPPFFEGLLPEGYMLEGILKQAKIDRDDLFALLIYVGSDLVGSITVTEEL